MMLLALNISNPIGCIEEKNATSVERKGRDMGKQMEPKQRQNIADILKPFILVLNFCMIGQQVSNLHTSKNRAIKN